MSQASDPRGYTNESLGIAVERLLCETAGIDTSNLAHRSSVAFENEMRSCVTAAAAQLPRILRHVGSDSGTYGGASKSPVDFVLADGSMLSVKSNLRRSSGKVCPPEVGQPGMAVYGDRFGFLYAPEDFDEEGLVTVEAFKRVAQDRIVDKVQVYLNFLFDCDYLLWVWHRPAPGYAIFLRDEVPAIQWDKSRFSFTRTPETWNESCAVRYLVTDKKSGREIRLSIGEFQVHNHRSSYKFRANLANLRRLFDAVG